MTMALAHRRNRVTEWRVFHFPERWGWPFESGDDQRWLRVEEFPDGDTLATPVSTVN